MVLTLHVLAVLITRCLCASPPLCPSTAAWINEAAFDGTTALIEVMGPVGATTVGYTLEFWLETGSGLAVEVTGTVPAGQMLSLTPSHPNLGAATVAGMVSGGTAGTQFVATLSTGTGTTLQAVQSGGVTETFGSGGAEGDLMGLSPLALSNGGAPNVIVGAVGTGQTCSDFTFTSTLTMASFQALNVGQTYGVSGGGTGDPHFHLFRSQQGFLQYQPDLSTNGTYSIFSTPFLQVNAAVEGFYLPGVQRHELQLIRSVVVLATRPDTLKETTIGLDADHPIEIRMNRGPPGNGSDVSVPWGAGVLNVRARGEEKKSVTIDVDGLRITVVYRPRFLGKVLPHMDVELTMANPEDHSVASGLVGFSVWPDDVPSSVHPKGKMNVGRWETQEFLAPGTPGDYLVPDGPYGRTSAFGLYRGSQLIGRGPTLSLMATYNGFTQYQPKFPVVGVYSLYSSANVQVNGDLRAHSLGGDVYLARVIILTTGREGRTWSTTLDGEDPEEYQVNDAVFTDAVFNITINKAPEVKLRIQQTTKSTVVSIRGVDVKVVFQSPVVDVRIHTGDEISPPATGLIGFTASEASTKPLIPNGETSERILAPGTMEDYIVCDGPYGWRSRRGVYRPNKVLV